MTSPSQHGLFDDTPNRPSRVIEVMQRQKPADKTQQAFQRLIAQVEEQRAVLQRWRDFTARHHQRVTRELLPLQASLWQHQRELALLFDDILTQPGRLRGKRRRTSLTQHLLVLIQTLLEEQQDKALETIHDKYSDISFAEDRELEMALSQEMIESMLGINLGDQHEARNIEELLFAAQQKISANRDKQRGNQADATQPARKRQSAKAQAAADRREEAAREVSQSVREVFRKLASALHPDREADPALRQIRTEQMQRVNLAYQSGDLLSLLNLQLEIEQIDASHLASLPAQRLTHYVSVLKEQVAELKAEIDSLIAPFIPIAGDARILMPERVERELNTELARMTREIEYARADLVKFRDPATLVDALNGLQPPGGADPFDDLAFMMGAFATMPDPTRKQPRKRKK